MIPPNKIVQEFRLIKEEYAHNPDVFCKDDERVRKLKYIIDHLDIVDRTIILLYAEYQSLREVAKLMGVSHATIRTEINRIKQIVINEYENLH